MHKASRIKHTDTIVDWDRHKVIDYNSSLQSEWSFVTHLVFNPLTTDDECTRHVFNQQLLSLACEESHNNLLDSFQYM